MPLKNSPDAYGSLARTLHWTTAVLILVMLPLGLAAAALPQATDSQIAVKAAAFSAHKTLGVLILILALTRIGWAILGPHPAPLHGTRRLETLLAATVHWTLYGALVAAPLSGWLHHAATTGFAPILWPFGQSLPFVPKDEHLAALFSSLHLASVWVLSGALALHVAGALKHALIDRDGTLARMLKGRPAAGDGVPAPRGAGLASAAVWTLALGLGTLLWLAAPRAPALPPAPTLTQTDTEWRVEEGTLSIAITQMGSTVEGTFADWTAAIAFSPDATDGRHGAVTAEIAIPSLTLGAVTAQAMGPDFFAAEAHPVALFVADIRPAETGYLADGTLSLKGAEVPVSLPFTLALEGDSATMEGTLALDRRAFGIGAGYADPATLGFDVKVRVRLSATRSTGS